MDETSDDPTPENPQPEAPAAKKPDEETKPKKYDGFYKPWGRFTEKKKFTSGVPSLDVDSEGRPAHFIRRNTEGVVSRLNATISYQEAKATCEAKVNAIVRECRRLNQKYYDRRFDLPHTSTLSSLNSSGLPTSMTGLTGVGSVKRVEDIYDDPQFFIDGAAANDVRQGINGDCWFLAAITALSGKPALLEKLCVAQDPKVGVYGFVFFRDGEWISEVVDDRLCLRQSDENYTTYPTEYLLKTYGHQDALKTPLAELLCAVGRLPKEFRDSLREGSNALYFASCRDSNETWLPLMEKAYAKAHGDYQAIEGGFPGEGIEDLTGGVASVIRSEDVLDKEQLWQELTQVNDKFLFGCCTRRGTSNPADEEGFVRCHAYTVLEAREIDKPKSLIEAEERESKMKKKSKKNKAGETRVRLLKIHNPWGKQEWNGAWSDGAKEWTPEVMKELGHTFGDDGLFWITYQDFLRYYPEIDRTRLFGDEWTLAQQWTAVNVPWTAEYLDSGFKVVLSKPGPVVLVLSQPDDRYFQGLTGRYFYQLHFRLYKEGEDTYLLRSMEDSGSNRSVKAESDLEPGTYTVLVKIAATRSEGFDTPEEVIKKFRANQTDKLLAVGKSFDLTHSKGKLREKEQENETKKKKDAKDKEHKELMTEREQNRKQRMRDHARARRVKAEEKKKKDEKMAIKKAELKAKKEAKEAEKKKKADEEEQEKSKNKQKENGTQTELDAPVVGDKSPSNEESVDKAADKDSSSSSTSVGQPTPESEKCSDSLELEAKDNNTKETKDVATSTDDDKKAKDKDAKDPADGEDSKKVDDAPECESDSDPDISDVSSVNDDDFEWDDNMDGPIEDESDSDSEDEDKDDMFADDPWNATCVIGLRVCSMDKDASIKVVHGIKRGLNLTPGV